MIVSSITVYLVHIQGELVYVNFGSDKDYEYLAKKGIDLKNCIALVRYGGMSRSKKVCSAFYLFSHLFAFVISHIARMNS